MKRDFNFTDFVIINDFGGHSSGLKWLLEKDVYVGIFKVILINLLLRFYAPIKRFLHSLFKWIFTWIYLFFNTVFRCGFMGLFYPILGSQKLDFKSAFLHKNGWKYSINIAVKKSKSLIVNRYKTIRKRIVIDFLSLQTVDSELITQFLYNSIYSFSDITSIVSNISTNTSTNFSTVVTGGEGEEVFKIFEKNLFIENRFYKCSKITSCIGFMKDKSMHVFCDWMFSYCSANNELSYDGWKMPPANYERIIDGKRVVFGGQVLPDNAPRLAIVLKRIAGNKRLLNTSSNICFAIKSS